MHPLARSLTICWHYSDCANLIRSPLYAAVIVPAYLYVLTKVSYLHAVTYPCIDFPLKESLFTVIPANNLRQCLIYRYRYLLFPSYSTGNRIMSIRISSRFHWKGPIRISSRLHWKGSIRISSRQ